MDFRETWVKVWPPMLAVAVVSAVGAPAAVASYRHAHDVVSSTGDAVMAPWLPLSVDGMLVAALVVIWVRRRRGQRAGRGPWAAFLFGMVVTILANLAAVTVPSVKAYAVALFPPLAFAITLELVALVAHRAPGSVTVGELVASRNLPPAAPVVDLETAHLEAAAADQPPAANPQDETPTSTTATGPVVDATTEEDVTNQDWMTDLVVRGVARDVARARSAGRAYGRGRVARDHQLTDHQARAVLAEIDRRDLVKAGA